MTIALKMTPLATHRGVPFFRHPIVFVVVLETPRIVADLGSKARSGPRFSAASSLPRSS